MGRDYDPELVARVLRDSVAPLVRARQPVYAEGGHGEVHGPYYRFLLQGEHLFGWYAPHDYVGESSWLVRNDVPFAEAWDYLRRHGVPLPVLPTSAEKLPKWRPRPARHPSIWAPRLPEVTPPAWPADPSRWHWRHPHHGPLDPVAEAIEHEGCIMDAWSEEIALLAVPFHSQEARYDTRT